MKRISVLLLTLALLAVSILFSIPAYAADSEINTDSSAPSLNKTISFGIDLTDEQEAFILDYFGADRASARIIYVNNQQEHEYLGAWIPVEQIGNKTISCAYVQPTQSGGIQVKTANLNYVTGNMIASLLSTAGITDCNIVAAAPFEVSGTGALTGIILAYEDASGQRLSNEKLGVAFQEYILLQDVDDVVGEDKALQIINAVKQDVIKNNVDPGDVDQLQAIVDRVLGEIITEEDSKISDELCQRLIELLIEIAKQSYQYEDVAETLSRIEDNLSEQTQVDLFADNTAPADTDIWSVPDAGNILSGTNDDLIDQSLRSDTGTASGSQTNLAANETTFASWQDAYYDFICNGKFKNESDIYNVESGYVGFALWDMDDDGIPELIVYNNGNMGVENYSIVYRYDGFSAVRSGITGGHLAAYQAGTIPGVKGLFAGFIGGTFYFYIADDGSLGKTAFQEMNQGGKVETTDAMLEDVYVNHTTDLIYWHIDEIYEKGWDVFCAPFLKDDNQSDSDHSTAGNQETEYLADWLDPGYSQEATETDTSSDIFAVHEIYEADMRNEDPESADWSRAYEDYVMNLSYIEEGRFMGDPNNAGENGPQFVQEIKENARNNSDSMSIIVYDINADNIPELILYNLGPTAGAGGLNIMTYKDGKVAFVDHVPGPGCYYDPARRYPGLFTTFGSMMYGGEFYITYDGTTLAVEQLTNREPDGSGSAVTNIVTGNIDLYNAFLSGVKIDEYMIGDIRQMGWDEFVRLETSGFLN